MNIKRKYAYILGFNDGEECYLFKTRKDAIKEAFTTLKTDEKTTEAYLINLDKAVIKTLKLKLDEKVI